MLSAMMRGSVTAAKEVAIEKQKKMAGKKYFNGR
jgi:hypothetical protein